MLLGTEELAPSKCTKLWEAAITNRMTALWSVRSHWIGNLNAVAESVRGIAKRATDGPYRKNKRVSRS